MKTNKTIFFEKPIQRLQTKGVQVLSINELLEILLGVNNPMFFTALLKTKKTLAQLAATSLSELAQVKGFTKIRAAKMLCALELGKRLVNQSQPVNIRFQSPINVYDLLKNNFLNLTHEELWLIYLDNKLHILHHEKVYQGMLNNIFFAPQEIFRHAIINNARGLILVHNHPSGDATPSANDIKTTANIREAARLLNIYLVDHIIIGKNELYSIMQREKIYPASGLIKP